MKRLAACVIVGLFLLATWGAVPPAQGVGTITYTSTADFDGGNKSDPGQSWFAQNGIDQPSNWESKPRAWTQPNGDLYTVWQGDFDFKIYIAKWTKGTGRWTQAIVEATNPITGDGHGSPSIGVQTNGTIHVFCCSHATKTEYFRSDSPGNISSFTELAGFSGLTSYPNILILSNGTFLLFYRLGTSNNAAWIYRFSTNGGVSWSAERVFIDFRTTNGIYVSNFEQSGSDYTFAFMRSTPPTGVRNDLYMARFNFVSGHVFSISGTDLGTTVTLAEADANLKIRITADLQVFYPAVHLVGGYPFIIYLVEATSGGLINVNWTRWNGSVWSANATILQTASANNMGDFRVLSSTDVRAYYPRSTLDVTGGGVLYEWRFNGTAWVQNDIPIMGSSWSHGAMITRNPSSDSWLVFDERYPETTNLDSRVWAYGDNGFLRHNETSGSFGVETLTDNPNIDSGTFALANSIRENFNYTDADARTYVWDALRRGLSDQLIGCTQEIIGGVLNQTLDTTIASNACAIRSTWNFTGDFDIRVKYSLTDFGTNHQRNLFVLDEPVMTNGAGSYPAGTDGIIYRILNDDIHSLFNVSNGVTTQIGSSSFPVCRNPCWMRFVKSGTSFTNYYSTDGTIWNQDETTTIIGMPPSVYVYMETIKTSNVDGVASSEVDDFQIFSGALGGLPYRLSGEWVSPNTTFNGEVVESIVVAYSGASSTQYVDEIAVVDSNGKTLYADGTNRVNGSSATFSIGGNSQNALFGIDWAIRITLAGDGSGSANVTSITVNTVRSMLTIATSDAPMLFVFVGILIAGLAGAAWIRNKRGGGR